MAKILRPRRGLHSYATSQNIVLNKGEVFFSYDSNDYSGVNRIYIGDGSSSISNLTPFINNSSVDYASTSDYSSKASSATKATRSMASSYVKLNSTNNNDNYYIGLFENENASCYSCYYTDNIVINPKKKYISMYESTNSATACIAPIGSTYLNTSSNTTYSTGYYATEINLGISDENAPTYTANNIVDPTGMSSTYIKQGNTYPSYAKINAIDGINLAIYTTRNLMQNNGSTHIVDYGLFLNTNNAYGSTYENIDNINTINYNGSTISDNSSTHTINKPNSKITYKYTADSSTYLQSMDMSYDDITRTFTNLTNSSTAGWNGSTINSLNDYLGAITPNEYISVHYSQIAIPKSNNSLQLFNTAATTSAFYNNSSYNFGKNITTVSRTIPSITSNSATTSRSITMVQLKKGFYLISLKEHPTGNVNADKVISVGLNINSTTAYNPQSQYEVVYIGTGAYHGQTITHPVYIPSDSILWVYGRAEGANYGCSKNASTYAVMNLWMSVLRLGDLI